jgi:hypothetical protein
VDNFVSRLTANWKYSSASAYKVFFSWHDVEADYTRALWKNWAHLKKSFSVGSLYEIGVGSRIDCENEDSMEGGVNTPPHNFRSSCMICTTEAELALARGEKQP